jgi:Alcohol dehydrogenase GroES-like domain
MNEHNSALWLPRRGAKFEVGPAPYTPPAADEVVVRVRAVAVNPVDGLPGYGYRLILPWLTFPAVIGGDIAGEVVEAGPNVTRLRPGDRVLGQALGLERSRNRAAEGAFQKYTSKPSSDLPPSTTQAIPGVRRSVRGPSHAVPGSEMRASAGLPEDLAALAQQPGERRAALLAEQFAQPCGELLLAGDGDLRHLPSGAGHVETDTAPGAEPALDQAELLQAGHHLRDRLLALGDAT